MLWYNHILFSYIITFILFLTKFLELDILGLTLVGLFSLAPDLDLIFYKNKSKVFYIKNTIIKIIVYLIFTPIVITLFFIKKVLNIDIKHREITHSIIFFLVMLFMYKYILATLKIPEKYLIYISIGYISHILADSFTKKGIYLLYPLKVRVKFSILGEKYYYNGV